MNNVGQKNEGLVYVCSVISLWLYWPAPVTHNITICSPMLYSKVCDIYLLELIFYLRAFLQWITHSLDSLYCPLKASWFSSTFPEEYPCPLTKSVHLQHFNNVRSKLKKCMVPEDPDYFVLTKWWSMEMQWECVTTTENILWKKAKSNTRKLRENSELHVGIKPMTLQLIINNLRATTDSKVNRVEI